MWNLSDFYRDRKMRGGEAQVLVLDAVARDEFLKGAEFVLLPPGIIDVFVEQDDAAGDDARRQPLEDGDRRRVEVGVDMQKAHRAGVAREEARQAVLEPA